MLSCHVLQKNGVITPVSKFCQRKGTGEGRKTSLAVRYHHYRNLWLNINYNDVYKLKKIFKTNFYGRILCSGWKREPQRCLTVAPALPVINSEYGLKWPFFFVSLAPIFLRNLLFIPSTPSTHGSNQIWWAGSLRTGHIISQSSSSSGPWLFMFFSSSQATEQYESDLRNSFLEKKSISQRGSEINACEKWSSPKRL